MEIEPWIAKEYENIDELTWKITLNDGVVFSNGRACDGEAVKECLEALVANHERAAGDLCIDTIEADGNTITIKTTEPKPALINYLSDPYGCIIDTQAGITDNGIVIGTGPYVATDLVTDDHLTLVKNENYWNGDVNVDEITGPAPFQTVIPLHLLFRQEKSMLLTAWHMQAILFLKMRILPSPVLQQAVPFMHG